MYGARRMIRVKKPQFQVKKKIVADQYHVRRKNFVKTDEVQKQHSTGIMY